MKMRFVLLGMLFFVVLGYAGCKKKPELPVGMQYAPICPENFARVESTKSCEVIFVD